MPKFERLDWNVKRPVPVTIKLLLMLAIIMGILMRNCWKKNQAKPIIISDVKITEITRVSIEVSYYVQNLASIPLKKSFIIRVFTKSGEELASKITQNEIPARSKKHYVKILQKFNMPLKDKSEIGHATVEVYTSAFSD
ncbi:MAG: hypothetical protein B6D62_05040 [Candidatus Cloacimonas sp. 4484_275]|nr:MAG: hypothetical protein B6D62_05040 [Candidatus Cloacimonas sp. 4484_275]